MQVEEELSSQELEKELFEIRATLDASLERSALSEGKKFRLIKNMPKARFNLAFAFFLQLYYKFSKGL